MKIYIIRTFLISTAQTKSTFYNIFEINNRENSQMKRPTESNLELKPSRKYFDAKQEVA